MNFNQLPFLILLFFTTISLAQNATVSGRILDGENHQEMPYSEVSLTDVTNEKQNFGVISDEKGRFLMKNVPYGDYLLKISFLGYEPFTKSLQINTSKINLGDILMQLATNLIEEVVVEGKKADFTYQVDRKTINAAAFPEATNAIDLLTNVPSLQVSVDGKVTYREGGTFVVYINGIIAKDGQERLRTLEASQIEKIDIITNPSAKYSASGTAGIIRVVLKKNKLEGYVIDLSTEVSTLGTRRFNFSVDKKGKRGGWHTSGNYRNNHWGDYTAERKHWVQNTNGQRFETLQNEDFSAQFEGAYINFGFNYDLTDNDFIDFSIDYDPLARKENKFSKSKTSERTFDATNTLLSSEDFQLDNHYQFIYQTLGTNLEYSHFFNKDKTHSLKLYSGYETYFGAASSSAKNHLVSSTENNIFGNKTLEKNEISTATNIDYELPLTDNISIEVGGQIETDHIPEITAESGYFNGNNIVLNSIYVAPNQLINYKQNIYSGYFTFKSSFGKFEYKLGLRAEHTVRDISYTFDNQLGVRQKDHFKANFTDWFPSVHLLYSFSEDSQISGNYSRRISRPHYASLVPAFVWDDKYAFSTGNSRLLPSYTDSYELAYKRSWGRDFVSLEVFARNQHDIMNKYSRVFYDDVLLFTDENVGSAWAVGAELMTGVDIFKWWNVNASFTSFYYDQDLSVDGKPHRYKQWRYNAKMNNTFKLPRSFSFRLNAGYQSPTMGLQNEMDGIFLANASLTKSWQENRWSLSVFGSNIFDSHRYTQTRIGENFSTHTKMVYRPYVGFTLKYQFNNQK